MAYSLDVAILAAFPALLLTWCGLYVLMRDVESIVEENKRKQGTAAAARQINQEQQADKRKRAALSHRAHLYHLKDSMSWNVVGGALLVAAAVSVTRVTLWYNWSTQATVVSAAAGWIVSAVVDVALLLPALLMYFHALKWRTLAVFALAGAVMIDWQVHVYTLQFEYAAVVLTTPSALYTLLLSSTAVSLITGIITAVTCFGFIGLQFSRMQLSRNGLSVLVASLESVINRQKAALLEEQQQSAHRALQADELVRMLECINIVRPIPKEYAWALASAANTSTFQRSFEQATANAAAAVGGHAATGGTPASHSPALSPAAKEGSPLMVYTRLAGGTVDSRPSPNRSSAVRPAPTTPHSATVRLKAEAIVALSQPDHAEALSDDDLVGKPHPAGSARRSSLSLSTHAAAHLSLPSATVVASASSPVGARSSKAGWSASSPKAAAPEESGVSGGAAAGGGQWATTRSGRSSVNSVRSSHAAADAPLSPSNDGSIVLALGSGGERERAAEKEAEPSKHSNSLNLTSGVGGGTGTDHSARCRQYETELLAMLHAQAQQATIAALEHPHVAGDKARSSSIAQSADGDAHEFTLPPSAAAKPPTLLELLAHPVCVELVKDELGRIHSVENVVFYLHAVRYRQLQSAKARRAVAQQLYDTFVAEGAPQQINISTRQREAVQATLKRRGDDACAPSLFREAEREVALLMETNCMKSSSFLASPAYRLCTAVLRGLDMGRATGKWAEQQRAAAADGGGEITLSDVASSQTSRRKTRQKSSVTGHVI